MTEPDPTIDMFAGTGSVAMDVAALRPPCWIPYPRANLGVRKLRELLQAPKSHRPLGMLLYGSTNSGKTTIARHFQNIINKESVASTEECSVPDDRPVFIVQAPPYASADGLLSGVLRGINAPFQETWRLERKLAQVLHLLPRYGIKMLIIDEIHNSLVKPHDKRVQFLNTIRYLSNELRIPIVAIGTDLALSTIQSDQQLGNRLEPFRLPEWKADKGFAQFLGGILKHLGLDPLEAVRSRKFCEKVINMTDGLTGEIWALSVKAADYVREHKLEQLNEDVLDSIAWVRPQERRSENGNANRSEA
ncbi:TniB family NTP-binding protein [Ferrovibrio sp.]|uniref:TniB family NTP-binding protein n=1 Tax=Ferrovibrio sp. TaxID=1917215 RepID=UPI001B655D12|nr:TniB family NTP-binding protein [Ferrovibrio sp.]MBP7065179.1 TniB family NTP-binding protein [Ferrovibrio sp.]